jgi:hypothetical protein
MHISMHSNALEVCKASSQLVPARASLCQLVPMEHQLAQARLRDAGRMPEQCNTKGEATSANEWSAMGLTDVDMIIQRILTRDATVTILRACLVAERWTIGCPTVSAPPLPTVGSSQSCRPVARHGAMPCDGAQLARRKYNQYN